MLFSINRQASGDFRHIAVAERGKLIGKEWAALTEGEKKVCLTTSFDDFDVVCVSHLLTVGFEQKYKDLQHEELTRYSSEFKDTYGYVAPFMTASPQAASASASA